MYLYNPFLWNCNHEVMAVSITQYHTFHIEIYLKNEWIKKSFLGLLCYFQPSNFFGLYFLSSFVIIIRLPSAWPLLFYLCIMSCSPCYEFSYFIKKIGLWSTQNSLCILVQSLNPLYMTALVLTLGLLPVTHAWKTSGSYAQEASWSEAEPPELTPF